MNYRQSWNFERLKKLVTSRITAWKAELQVSIAGGGRINLPAISKPYGKASVYPEQHSCYSMI